MSTPLLELERVVKDYDVGPSPARVLAGVDLTVTPGESIAIVGPSGSGKSTLLNLIGTLDRPSSGTVRFKGKDVCTLAEGELARFRNREIGFVFQMHHLLPQCTVLENTLLPTLVKKDSANAVDRATRLLQRVGLGERLHYLPGQLSGGECQRTAVVRALINQPSLLLADEPTGSLNQEAAEQLTRLLLQINHEENLTLIVVTHSPTIAAMMERVLELHQGLLRPLPGAA